jgi:1-deoxy-D-xylulose-5-phosphate synthase
VILQPRDGQQLIDALHSAFEWRCPTFIRYPKSHWQNSATEELKFSKYLEIGKAEKITAGGKICLVALGSMIGLARSVGEKLGQLGIKTAIVNALFVKPLDGAMLTEIAADCELIATLEDNVLAGGFGSAVLEFYNSTSSGARVLRFGWPDKFVKHGTSIDALRAENGLSPESIANEIAARWKHSNAR